MTSFRAVLITVAQVSVHSQFRKHTLCKVPFLLHHQLTFLMSFMINSNKDILVSCTKRAITKTEGEDNCTTIKNKEINA